MVTVVEKTSKNYREYLRSEPSICLPIVCTCVCVCV